MGRGHQSTTRGGFGTEAVHFSQKSAHIKNVRKMGSGAIKALCPWGVLGRPLLQKVPAAIIPKSRPISKMYVKWTAVPSKPPAHGGFWDAHCYKKPLPPTRLNLFPFRRISGSYTVFCDWDVSLRHTRTPQHARSQLPSPPLKSLLNFLGSCSPSWYPSQPPNASLRGLAEAENEPRS